MIRVGIATCSPFGTFGFDLVDELSRRGFEPVVVFAGPRSATSERGYRLKHHPRTHPIRHLLYGVTDNKLDIYRQYKGDLVYLKRHFNHPDTIALLRDWNLDLLLNAGGPIYRRDLIDGCGATILNCHMGLLPEIRGMNVAEWSVYHGYPIGNTVHVIRPGIDTGEIGFFFQQDPTGIRNIAELRRTLASQNSQHLATAVEAVAKGSFTLHPQEKSDGAQYYRMHERLQRVVNQRLENGFVPTIDISDRPYVRPASSTGDPA